MHEGPPREILSTIIKDRQSPGVPESPEVAAANPSTTPVIAGVNGQISASPHLTPGTSVNVPVDPGDQGTLIQSSDKAAAAFLPHNAPMWQGWRKHGSKKAPARSWPMCRLARPTRGLPRLRSGKPGRCLLPPVCRHTELRCATTIPTTLERPGRSGLAIHGSQPWPAPAASGRRISAPRS